MPRHGVLTWDHGTLRFYEAQDAEAALELSRKMWRFEAVMQVLAISAVTALLRGALSLDPIDRRMVREIAAQLQSAGFQHLLVDRMPGKGVPFGALIEDGPLAGLWHVELKLVTAGADGDY